MAVVGYLTRLPPAGAGAGRPAIVGAVVALPTPLLSALVDDAAGQSNFLSPTSSLVPATVVDGVAEGSCGSIPAEIGGISGGGGENGRQWREVVAARAGEGGGQNFILGVAGRVYSRELSCFLRPTLILL